MKANEWISWYGGFVGGGMPDLVIENWDYRVHRLTAEDWENYRNETLHLGTAGGTTTIPDEMPSQGSAVRRCEGRWKD